VRKIIDEQPETGRIRLSVPAIFEVIKKSNSSLNRKPKRQIEDSLERVLEIVKADLGDDDEDSMEGDFEGLEEPPAAVCMAHLSFYGGNMRANCDCLGTQRIEPKHRRLVGYSQT
jgi:hypothetical protein